MLKSRCISQISRLTIRNTSIRPTLYSALRQYSSSTTHSFELSPEQLEIQDLVRRVAVEKVAPRAKEIDQTAEYPQDMFDLLKELGLFTLPFPAEYGGQGSLLSGVVAIEQLGVECYNTAYLLLVQWLPISAILAAGSAQQKQELLPKLATGDARAAFSTTEPQSGSDIRGIKTKAKPMQQNGKDGYVLDGAKIWCTNAQVADFIIVACRLDDGKPVATKGPPPLHFFVVPKNTPGFSLGRHEEKLGGRGVPSSALFFDNCWVPQENLLGWEPGQGVSSQGFYRVMDAFNHSRPIIAARAVGLAQGALNKSIEFLSGRRAFGQTLTDFQGLRWMLADMEASIQASRLLTYRAAAMVDAGVHGTELAHAAAVAKLFATETAMKVATDAVQLHGGSGIGDSNVHRYFRDAKVLQIVEGTSQIQKNIISRGLVGKPGK